MLTYTEAQQIIKKNARTFGTAQITLEGALGRVLQHKIVADRDYPPFNRSAMDGYAIRLSDFNEGIATFKIKETIFAGSVVQGSIAKGECYKIMTGAAVPLDADVVVRKEDTSASSDKVDVLLPELKRFQNISRRGEDMPAGFEIIHEPVICTPSIIALLASLGYYHINVAALPKVALFTTGNEVVAANAEVSHVQIRNSNRWLLQSLLQKWGIDPFICKHIADEKESLMQAVTGAMEADIIIMCGGVSAGDADYVPEVLEVVGVQKLFHKVAIKPGKPIWCGKMPNGGLVFALPGNPFSCLVTYTIFIQHYLNACFGLAQAPNITLPLGEAKRKKTPLDEFFPVQFGNSPTAAVPVSLNGSGDIRLGLHAQAVALHPSADADLPSGTIVSCFSL